ncbi:MAG: OmpA family protein [Burkholderiales bacterium]|nr:OmpA family protein [Burkholderiales bacterium]
MSTTRPVPRWEDVEAANQVANRKVLANLLLEVARSVDHEVAAQVPSALDTDPRVEAMRHILLEPEQAALASLKEKFDDPDQFAAAVSAVLPAAIARAISHDDRLGHELAPVVETATQSSIRRDPRTLINILAPLMGPAIRKSVAETMDSSLQSLNQALKHSLSWQGLKWRMEAYRTGTSFAEVVLRHTLVFRVEHVFLIHRKTGLMLEHVAADQVSAKDPQLVSGMLSAIQDFVRDSFDESALGGIDTLRLGEFLLWCEEGPLAFLAAVIRGNPPENLHGVLRETLDSIHDEDRTALENFDGDVAAFANVRARLERCLAQQEAPIDQGATPFLWLIPLALMCGGAYWLVQRHLDGSAFEDYVRRLQAEPGIVVTGFERRDGAWHITGLRDPLAADPQELLGAWHVDPERISGNWEPYQALHPAIALKRIQATLKPPSTVNFALDGDTIRATGTAPRRWIEKARTLASVLPPGSAHLDLNALGDVQQGELERLRDAIQARPVFFGYGDALPVPGQETIIEAQAAELRELAAASQKFGVTVRATLIGHADSTGKDAPNLGLSLARAEAVRSLLRKQGVDPELLAVRGAGPLEPLAPGATEQDRSLNRRVSFTVSILD